MRHRGRRLALCLRLRRDDGPLDLGLSSSRIRTDLIGGERQENSLRARGETANLTATTRAAELLGGKRGEMVSPRLPPRCSRPAVLRGALAVSPLARSPSR